MSIGWGVVHPRALVVAALTLGCQGCYRHAPVGDVQVDAPGLHVVATHSTTSIVWPNGRVCTLNAGASAHLPPAPWRGASAPPLHAQADTHELDAFFFRLCEARANGDLSPEQYNMLLERFLSNIQRRDDRTPGVGRRPQPYSRPQRDPKLWHGEDAAGLSGATPSPAVPPGAPMDSGLPPPPPPAPIVPGANPGPLPPPGVAPGAPSTGALPDTRR